MIELLHYIQFEQIIQNVHNMVLENARPKVYAHIASGVKLTKEDIHAVALVANSSVTYQNRANTFNDIPDDWNITNND